ncbi:MAG: hypothetical protein H7039_14165 [Bryobacteraceae bacterium]|nr:hypothetical protein [Bryobacteraceae bacterium]
MTLTESLLRLLPDEITGDLLEESALHSRRWLWSQALRSCGWAIALSWRRGEIGAALLTSSGGVLLPLLAVDLFWAWIHSQVPLRAGLDRPWWMLACNLAIAAAGCAYFRREWTVVFMPLAALTVCLLNLAEYPLWYAVALVVLSLRLGRKIRCA